MINRFLFFRFVCVDFVSFVLPSYRLLYPFVVRIVCRDFVSFVELSYRLS
jgi:hypothetical protein